MKNQYSQFVKYLEKQDKVFIQRKGDNVYLTDSMIVLQVHHDIYTNLIRPLSGILIDVTTDCKGSKHSTDSMIKLDKGIDIVKYCDTIKDDTELTLTPLLIEIPSKIRSKNIYTRVLKSDTDIIGVNNEYLTIFKDCVNGNWRSSGRWNDSIVYKDDNCTIAVLPMRLTDDSLNLISK